jgi:hypothetical protein
MGMRSRRLPLAETKKMLEVETHMLVPLVELQGVVQQVGELEAA